jgi:hypothetical protein
MLSSDRTVHCEDAITWLQNQPVLTGCSIITSLPDASEFSNFSLDEWKRWFVDAAELLLSRCPDDGVAIFYQTDLKKDGRWIDKAQLVSEAANRSQHSLLWHKIVCRVAPGQVAFGRPGYSHLLCFSRGIQPDLARSTPDIILQAGEVTWTRGMGTEVCRRACEFVLAETQTRTIVDPFCGHGTVLAVANELGMRAIGVERGGSRARKARALRTQGFKLAASERAPTGE